MHNFEELMQEKCINEISNQLFSEFLYKGESFASIDKDGNIRVITDEDEIENIKEHLNNICNI